MQNTRKKECFTLIELLVVIAIIAILAGLLMPAVKSVWGQGKKTRARADIHALRMAIKEYESTYQYLPFTGTSGADKDETSSGVFLDILRGEGNVRDIQFLEPRTDSSGNPTFEDPWDNAYNVALDLDYDNEVASATTGLGQNVQGSVAVWSNGPDGGNDGGDDDDIASWHD